MTHPQHAHGRVLASRAAISFAPVLLLLGSGGQALSIAATLLSSAPAFGSVTVITNKTQWLNAVGPHEYLGFTGYPEFTVITTQYAEQGITFTDGNDFIFTTSSFPTDGHGLVSSDGFGNFGTVHMSFAPPRYAVAFDYIGGLQVNLYNGADLIFSSNQYVADFTPFLGFVSTTPLDAVIARDWQDGTISIDSLYFAGPIPAPGALGIFGLLAVVNSRQRRPQ